MKYFPWLFFTYRLFVRVTDCGVFRVEMCISKRWKKLEVQTSSYLQPYHNSTGATGIFGIVNKGMFFFLKKQSPIYHDD